MKINEVINTLNLYKEKFGNIDVKISKGYEEYETPFIYHKELIVEDCSLSVFSYGREGNIVLIGNDIYKK